WTNVAAADATSPYSASWVTTGVSDGLYDLQVITTDKSGNTLTSALITTVRVDNTAPVPSVVVANGVPNAFQNGTKIYFKSNTAGSFGLVATVTDGGSGAASATFPVLATAGWTHAVETVATPAGGPYVSTSFVWANGASTPATYTITVVDAAGNTSTSAFTFTADATAPTGSLTAPAAAANLRGSAAVTSNSADASSGVASAQFQTSPAGAGSWSNLGVADAITPYSTIWDTTISTDALYDLRVITTDNVGTAFTSATIANVRVDNTAPTGSITAPAANAFVNGANVAVSANSADAGSGISSAQFQTSPRGASSWTNLGAADATSPYGVTWNTTTYADGQYDLRVITTDKSGNTFTSAPVLAEVQNAAPTATTVQLLDSAGTAGKAEQGDRIVATFSETLRVSTMCSTWSGDFSDQTLAALGDVTVSVADGGVANDTLTVTSASCAFHFGTINLGSASYATGGNVTFSGSTTADKSTIAWNATTRTLTITLGHSAGTGTAGTVAGSAATYTPDAAIKNGFGTAITGTFNTGILTLF
ncbi:MAG TPA: Ig-like domain-containing protein, partial [Gaiellales bacterium]|nr:Ig-like domain-containing protein [Gaiellales bacterium]